MPVTVAWEDDSRTVIREIYSSVLDWPTLEGVLATVTEMMDSVDHRVDILLLLENAHLDSRMTAQFPQLARRDDFWRHPNLGYLVLVGAGPVMYMMLDTYRFVYHGQGEKFLTAATPDDALEVLRQQP